MEPVTELDIYERFELAFSRFPASAGRRLKSEPALAALLGLNRARVRKVLDRFVEDGILIRRHGSGTFLRKVLEVSEWGRADGDVVFDPFSVEEPEESRRRVSVADCSLKFAVLSDLLSPQLSGTYRKIFEGLASRCEGPGHTVEIHDSVRVAKSGASLAEVLKALRRVAYDGIIVRADDLSLFELLAPEERPPTLFIGVGMVRRELEPIVTFGRRKAMSRALALLHKSGARKIGLIGWDTPEGNEEFRRDYFEGILRLGLGYTACQFLGEDIDRNRALIKMLFGPHSESPDALYFSDDVALRYAAGVFKEMGIVPGRHVRVIAEADRDVSLPEGVDWSVMMFSPFQVGRLAIDCLEAGIQSPGDELVSLTHEASWRPRGTHFLV